MANIVKESVTLSREDGGLLRIVHEPFVHLHNHRDPGALRGKLYTLGMQAPATKKLVGLLRGVRA